MTHRELVLAMHNRIDRDGLRRVHEVFNLTTWSKFFDVEPFVDQAAIHALRFNETLKPKSRCADIGCGFGYTALALECLGHTCLAWDAPADVLKNVAHCIPVKERNFQMIHRGDDGKEFLQTFDLVFLHGVFPMRDARGWWGWDDYRELVIKLIHGLNPGGLLEIIVNRGDEEPMICDAERWGRLALPGSLQVADNVITFYREGVTFGCDTKSQTVSAT